MKTLWSTLSSKKPGFRKAPCFLDVTLDADLSAQSPVTLEVRGQSRDLIGTEILWMYTGFTCSCCGMRHRELLSALGNAVNAKESFYAQYPRLKAVEAGEDVRNIARIELMLCSGDILSIGMDCSSSGAVSEFEKLAETITDLASLIPIQQGGCKTQHKKCNSSEQIQLEGDTAAAEEADRHMKELLETIQGEQLAFDTTLRRKKQNRKAKINRKGLLKQLQRTTNSDGSETLQTHVSSGGIPGSSNFFLAAGQEHCVEQGTPVLQQALAERQAEQLAKEAYELERSVEEEDIKAQRVGEEEVSDDSEILQTNVSSDGVPGSSNFFLAADQEHCVEQGTPVVQQALADKQVEQLAKESHELELSVEEEDIKAQRVAEEEVSDDSETLLTNVSSDGDPGSSSFVLAADQEHCVEQGTPVLHQALADKQVEQLAKESYERELSVEEEDIKAQRVAKEACKAPNANETAGRRCRAEPQPESAAEAQWEKVARTKRRCREEEHKWNRDELAQMARRLGACQQTNDRQEKHEQPLVQKQLDEECEKNKQNRREDDTGCAVKELELPAKHGRLPLEFSADKVDKATQTVATSYGCGQLDVAYLGEYKIDETLPALTPMTVTPIATRASCFMAFAGLPAKVLLSGSGYRSCSEFHFCGRNQDCSTDSHSEASTYLCEDTGCPSCASILLDCEVDSVQS